MLGKRLPSALIAFGLVAGSLAVAIPAYADDYGTMPSGCSMSPVAPTVVSSHVHYSGTGYCSIAYEMDTRLIHNYDGLPDVEVADVQSFSIPSFSGSGSVCDGGGTTQYYTELAFYYNSRGDTQRVSSTKTLTHC